MVKPSVLKSRALPLLACLLLILATRWISLDYQIALHPDEYKFTRATESLMEHILDPSSEFVEEKEYPEGAYVFMLPVFLLGRGLCALAGLDFHGAVWGRIAAVLYFLLAYLVGRRILLRRLEAPAGADWIYGLTLCFSIFFLEHSRYATGDMIALFLLLVTVELSCAMLARTGEPGRGIYLLACLAAGALTAVKYPLVQFLLIPLAARLYGSGGKKGDKVLWLLLGLAAAFCGLMLCSPKAMGDLGYFLRATQRELGAYVTQGTGFEAGGVLNHIASMGLFTLLYSDFPLMLPIMAAGIFSWWRTMWKGRKGPAPSGLDFLLKLWVPAMGAVFFIYNIFIRLMIFRTFTPYFGLAAVYGAYFLSRLWEKGGRIRGLLMLLGAVMVLRGGFLTWVMSSQERVTEQMLEKIQMAVNEDWDSTLLLGSYVIPLPQEELKDPVRQDLDLMLDLRLGDPSMKPGDLVITGALEHCLAGDYILPILGQSQDSAAAREYNYQWAFFKEVNAGHYVGQSYPDWYYYLFGGWLRGSTLSSTVIPCNMIYYYPSPAA